jgi:hypothetical protein
MADELPPAVARFIADADPFVRGTDEAGDAARKFGREADKAALQARRMGLAAKEAGERAAKAGLLAKEAAEKAAKGMLKEEQAAQAAARAVRELERAEIAQSLAAIAAGEASDKAAKAHRHHADSLRNLGRDAEETGGLLARGMQAGASAAESALDGLGKTSPLAMAAVVAGIGLLPVAAEAAGGAVTLGLGGALAGLGLAASEGSKKGQAAIASLKEAGERAASEMGRPFEDVWTRIAAVGQRELGRFAPRIRADLADLAPEFSSFADQTGSSLHELQPAFDGVERAFAAVLRTLGPQMPAIMRTLRDAIKDVTDEVEKNPQAITNMVQGLATLVEWGGKTVGFLERTAQAAREHADAFQWMFKIMAPATSILQAFHVGERDAAAGARDIQGAVNAATDSLSQSVLAAAGVTPATQAVAEAWRIAGDAGQKLEDRVKALNDAMSAYFNPALDVLSATNRMHDAFAASDKALARSKTTLAQRHGLLESDLRTIGEWITAQQGAGKNVLLTNRRITEQIPKLLALASGSREGRAAINGLAQSMGGTIQRMKDGIVVTDRLGNRIKVLPSGKIIKISADTRKAAAAFEDLRQRLMNLHNRTITITAVTRGSGVSSIGAGRALHAEGGYIRGPGTGTSDSIPAWLSNGEYVMPAARTADYRPQLDAMRAGRYAGGGLVVEHPKIPAGTRGQITVGGVAVSTSQWRNLGLTLGKEFIKAMTGSSSEIASMDRRLEKAIAKLIGGKKTTLDNKLIAYLDKNSKHLEALAKQRDAATKAIAAAKDYASGVTSNARSFAGLTSLDGPMNAQGIRIGLGAKVTQLKAFAKAISDLNRRGLSKALLRQVIDAGPEQGLELARMLLSADRSTMSGINKAQAEIDKVSTSLGRSSADILYDAGAKAGQGFLTGLQASLKSLDKEMDKIAKKMAATLKKALHIKSPSRHPDILHAADMVVAGFAGGMVKGLPHLDKASALMAARIARPRARLGLVAPLVAHRGGGTMAGGEPVVVENHLKVFLDGRELRARVQTETLRYNRNNGSDGNTRRR